MKTCPYCNFPVEENWSYCRNCNKPLITNLKDVIEKSVKVLYGGPEAFHLEIEEESDHFDDLFIKDDEIDQKIKKIDAILESKEVIGDQIPGVLLLEKSSLYYKKRDLSEALKNLELALKNFKTENDLLNIAICFNEIGIIQEDNGIFDQAIYNFNRALEILKDLNDNSKIIKVLNNIGNIYFIIKDLEQSYNYYQEAFQISQKEGLIFDEIKSSSNLVEVLYQLHDYERIKEILTRNLEFFKEDEDIYGIIQTKIKFGKLYFMIGEDYDESYQHLIEALQVIKKIGENISVYIKAKLEWECYLYLGKIYHLRDNSTKAENLFIQSLEAIRIFEIGDSIKESEILENLAELYISKGDVKKAIEYYDLACEIFIKFGDNGKNAELKFKIGRIYLEFEENSSKAINYFEEALEIYDELGYTKQCALILHKLGEIYLDKGMIEMAISHFDEARKNYNEIKDHYNADLLNEKIKSLKS